MSGRKSVHSRPDDLWEVLGLVRVRGEMGTVDDP